MSDYWRLTTVRAVFDQRCMPIQTMAHKGQSAVRSVDFGSGLLESKSTHEPGVLTG